jgi:multiple sugar transport system substrate-binding protein
LINCSFSGTSLKSRRKNRVIKNGFVPNEGENAMFHLPTRRALLKKGSASLALTAAVGIAPRFIKAAGAQQGLASGMTGGPTGFPGAEHFQYNDSHSEGRAIEGAKKLKAAGKAPKKLVMLLTDGAIGQITQPFPAGAPTVKDVWEKETGIQIELVGAPAGDIWKRVLQDVTTQSAAFDIYTHPWNSIGDLVEAGGALNLNDFVAKYKPDWADPERGAQTPQIAELLHKYAGNYHGVSLDGDFQTWVYNKYYFEDPANGKEFSQKYGRPLAPPRTWQESDQISEFFTGRGGLGGTKIYGNGNDMAPFWGLPRFYARFAAQAVPNMYWFDDNGTPNLDTPAGIKAATEYVATKKWSHPDILSWTYAEGYAGIGSGTTAHLTTYTNVAKFVDRKKEDGSPASPATGKLSAYLPPGVQHGDQLVRRSVIYYNITGTVSPKSSNPEAAYLFLQWLSSTRTFSWMTGNPGGYFDPAQKANFAEPLVQQTYHPYMMDAIQETIKRSVPTINFAGQTALDTALDEELQAALTGQKSPEEAMKAASAKWKKIIQRKGEDKMIAAIKASRAAWPTEVDKA